MLSTDHIYYNIACNLYTHVGKSRHGQLQMWIVLRRAMENVLDIDCSHFKFGLAIGRLGYPKTGDFFTLQCTYDPTPYI